MSAHWKSHHTESHKGPKNSHGQISILIVLSFIPMFTLFAFVVNVGMLVHAKIALQNAADLAAYAGAAAQARQLTTISHLNYQMRQTYKKFLFKYYVMGNLSMKCFPRPGGEPLPPTCSQLGNSPSYEWVNISNSGTVGNPPFPQMPIVCINLSTTSNVCQLAQFFATAKTPSCVPFTPTCAVIQSFNNKAAEIQRASCTFSSVLNTEMLTMWLYATEYETALNSDQSLAGLVDDIGLIPEELLLWARVQNVWKYVNTPPNPKLNMTSVAQLERSADRAAIERSVMAFRTAQGNLNKNVFVDESVQLSELLPRSGDLLHLQRIQVKLDTAAGHLDSAPGGSGAGGDCILSWDFFRANPVVGVYKRPDSYVYYAVKLTAQAKIMFNPFPFGHPNDTIELTAYSAAAPFGSRIGPQLPDSHFYVTKQLRLHDGSTKEVNYPSLVIDNDGARWDSKNMLQGYRNVMQGAGNGAVNQGAIGRQELLQGVQASLVPDQFEVGRYNIPVDVENKRPDTEGLVRYYTAGNRNYSAWAPVIAVGGQETFMSEMKQELTNVASFAGLYTQGPLQQARQQLANTLDSKISGIIGELRRRQAINVVHIPDPFSTTQYQTNPPPSIYGKVGVRNLDAAKELVATSYSTDHDPHYYQHGREGYSVKFVPFRMIFSSIPGATMSNFPAMPFPTLNENFPDKQDLLKLEH